MKNNIYIRNFLGACLLAIFVLSNTPIRVLHYFFANHTDVHTVIFDDESQAQLQATGIDCHYDSNVVISPYTYAIPLQITGLTGVGNVPFLVATTQFSFTSLLGFEHRGPPADLYC